jgi:hypothetical protein
MGRTSGYTPEIGEKICEGIASGKSLRRVCQEDGMPTTSMVCRWLLSEKYEDFREQYARARRIQYERLADELFDIADDGSNDWMTIQRGKEEIEVANHEHINRSRLRVDTRKWFLSKVLPKIYGDKVEVSNSGKADQLGYGALPMPADDSKDVIQ